MESKKPDRAVRNPEGGERMFDPVKFGGMLARLRKRADMTQSELGDRLGVTRQAVSKYEVGTSFPDLSMLASIAEVFGVSVDELIAAGDPSDGERRILGNLARGEESEADNMEDVENLAPLLRPSTLERISDKLLSQGVDITKIVELSKYLDDAGTADMIRNASFDSLDGKTETELMEHLIPLLDEKSKTALFGKVLEGELDWHYLKAMMPYITYLGSQIESAYVEGVFPREVVEWLYEANRAEWQRWYEDIEN